MAGQLVVFSFFYEVLLELFLICNERVLKWRVLIIFGHIFGDPNLSPKCTDYGPDQAHEFSLFLASFFCFDL